MDQFSTVGFASLGLESRASIENPSVSLQDPDSFNELFGSEFGSDSGVKVTPQKSLSLAAVWQAVSMISGDLARLPLDVYRRTDDGEREVDKAHAAWRIVRKRPNDEQHAFKFWRTLFVHTLLWSNGWAWIVRDKSGQVESLIPLLPDRTSLYRDPKSRRLYVVTETQNLDGDPWIKPFPYADVIHISGISTQGTIGAEMVKHARQAWGLALARQKFESRFFKHGVRSGGILELPLGMTEQGQNNLSEGFKKTHEGEDGWFKTVILRDGAKFHQTSFNAKESQLTESSERSVREIARYFNLLPSRLGVEGSVSYNSSESDNQAYLDRTLAPWMSETTNECNAKLLSDQEQTNDSHYFEHNPAALLTMDQLKRYQAYAIGLRNRFMTPNIVCAKENMPKLPWGDEPLPIAGASAAGGADKGENNKPRGPADDAPPDETGEESERQHLMRRVLFRLTDQARRKASRGHRAWGEWFEGGAKTHRSEARDLLGDDELVTGVLTRLSEVNAAPVAELAARVEEICNQLERDA